MSKKTDGSTPQVRRVTVTTNLTIYTAPDQKHILLDALQQSSILELDLAAVGEVDSAGLQVLLLAKREALAAGKELRIVKHSPAVGDLLNFVDVAGYFGDPLVIPAQARS